MLEYPGISNSITSNILYLRNIWNTSVYLIQNSRTVLLPLVLHHLSDFALIFLFFFFFPLFSYLIEDGKNSFHLLKHLHSKDTPLYPVSSSLNIPFAFGLCQLWLSLSTWLPWCLQNGCCPFPPISHAQGQEWAPWSVTAQGCFHAISLLSSPRTHFEANAVQLYLE